MGKVPGVQTCLGVGGWALTGRVTIQPVHSFWCNYENIPIYSQSAQVGMENGMVTLIIGHQMWLRGRDR